MEDNQNGRRPKWKTTKIEDDQNGRRPKWEITFKEENQNGRRPKQKMTKMENKFFAKINWIKFLPSSVPVGNFSCNWNWVSLIINNNSHQHTTTTPYKCLPPNNFKHKFLPYTFLGQYYFLTNFKPKKNVGKRNGLQDFVPTFSSAQICIPAQVLLTDFCNKSNLTKLNKTWPELGTAQPQLALTLLIEN